MSSVAFSASSIVGRTGNAPGILGESAGVHHSEILDTPDPEFGVQHGLWITVRADGAGRGRVVAVSLILDKVLLLSVRAHFICSRAWMQLLPWRHRRAGGIDRLPQQIYGVHHLRQVGVCIRLEESEVDVRRVQGSADRSRTEPASTAWRHVNHSALVLRWAVVGWHSRPEALEAE